MVTKDINLRIKAKALGIVAEDYETGKVALENIQPSSVCTVENVDSEQIRQIFTKGHIEENDILGHKQNCQWILYPKKWEIFFPCGLQSTPR